MIAEATERLAGAEFPMPTAAVLQSLDMCGDCLDGLCASGLVALPPDGMWTLSDVQTLMTIASNN